MNTPAVFCLCGAQWHGHPHVERSQDVIYWHAEKHGLISHQRWLDLKRLCFCFNCKRARKAAKATQREGAVVQALRKP